MRFVLAFVAVSLAAACALAQEITIPQPVLPQSALVIETARGPARFTVELADEWREMQTGLMFRARVAPVEGMLFDYGRAQELAFWMKNTLVPLDMIFIAADGRVHRIAANTTPLSEDTVPSYGPVRAVLEIAGGRAAELGIMPGDLVRHAVFGTPPQP